MVLAAWLLSVQVGTSQTTVVPAAPAVVLQVTMPSGSVSRLTILSGKHGSVGRVSGPSLDLSPTLKDDGSLEIVVTTWVRDRATNFLVTSDIERQVLQAGEAARFAAAIFSIEVMWSGTVAMAGSTPSSAPAADRARCCVVCGSEVTCACAVVTPCGDCCAVSCGCQDGAVKRYE